MSYEDIEVERRDGIGAIRLARPEANNAVRLQTMRELCAALDELTEDASVRAITLSAVGKHFCAGAEFAFLDRLADMATEEIHEEIYAFFQGAARRLFHCPKPTVAMITGAAVTVGCELSLACDFRLAAPSARFQESWIRLGLIPPLGGLFLLPHIVGLGLAKDMVLRGRAVGAEAALAAGLAHEIVADDALEARGRELALELAALPATAYAAAKQGLHRGLESSMTAEWDANARVQSTLFGSADFREGLAAVKERRAPRFGRT